MRQSVHSAYLPMLLLLAASQAGWSAKPVAVYWNTEPEPSQVTLKVFDGTKWHRTRQGWQIYSGRQAFLISPNNSDYDTALVIVDVPSGHSGRWTAPKVSLTDLTRQRRQACSKRNPPRPHDDVFVLFNTSSDARLEIAIAGNPKHSSFEIDDKQPYETFSQGKTLTMSVSDKLGRLCVCQLPGFTGVKAVDVVVIAHNTASTTSSDGAKKDSPSVLGKTTPANQQKNDPQSPAAPDMTSDKIAKIRQMMAEGKWNDAETQLGLVLRIKQEPDALFMLAICREHTSPDVSLVEDCYRRAEKADPSSGPVWVSHALYLWKKGQAAKADALMRDIRRAKKEVTFVNKVGYPLEQ